MNTFNRFLVILGALSVMAFWIGVLLVVWFVPGELSLVLRQLAGLLRENPLLAQGLVTAFGLSFFLVALLVLAGEFTTHEAPTVRLAGGMATVSVEAIAQSVKGEVEAIAGVTVARPRVQPAKQGVRVAVEVRTVPGSHLPTKADEVSRAVTRTVEERLGVKVEHVRVNFHPEEGRPVEGRERVSGEIMVPEAASQETGASGETEAASRR